MNKEEILNTFLLANIPEIITQEEFDDVKKAIRELQQENKKLNGAIQTYDILLKANVEENKQLKDNWNKLKEYIRKNIIYDDVGMKILDPSPLEDYMQELEQGGEIND